MKAKVTVTCKVDMAAGDVKKLGEVGTTDLLSTLAAVGTGFETSIENVRKPAPKKTTPAPPELTDEEKELERLASEG